MANIRNTILRATTVAAAMICAYSSKSLATTILVLGDIQQTTHFFDAPSVSAWNSQDLETSGLQDRNIFFPTTGNHERYGSIILSARQSEDNAGLDIGGITSFTALSDQEAYLQMIRHFPHLERQATFYRQTATYSAEFADFCLLSFDGANIESDQGLMAFIESSFTSCRTRTSIDSLNQPKPIIVTSHYPIFSGQVDEEPSLATARLTSLFNQYRVALVLSGHEHYYLRYEAPGLANAGFASYLPVTSKYATLGNFANPYHDTFERLPISENGGAFQYYEGTHYGVLDISENGITVAVYGYFGDVQQWRQIDHFTAP